LSFTLSTFLRPFAPRALPRFRATMDALSSVAERLFGFVSMNTVSGPQQTSLLNAPHLPAVRSPTTPRCPRLTDLLSSPGLTARVSSHPVPGLLASWASPFSSRLATATGRIEFVNLPTSSSPPVAPHAASRRRSYLRLSRPGLAPSEDFHLTDSVRSQAHWRAASLPPGTSMATLGAPEQFHAARSCARFSPPGWECKLAVIILERWLVCPK
jgi:hypothetical protein